MEAKKKAAPTPKGWCLFCEGSRDGDHREYLELFISESRRRAVGSGVQQALAPAP